MANKSDEERLERLTYIIDRSCMDAVDLVQFLELTTEDLIAIMPDVLLQHERKFEVELGDGEEE